MKKTRILIGLAAGMCFLLATISSHARMSPRQIYKTKASGVVLIVASPEGSSSASAGTGSIIDKQGTVIEPPDNVVPQDGNSGVVTLQPPGEVPAWQNLMILVIL